jgi:hypothetical protein
MSVLPTGPDRTGPGILPLFRQTILAKPTPLPKFNGARKGLEQDIVKRFRSARIERVG